MSDIVACNCGDCQTCVVLAELDRVKAENVELLRQVKDHVSYKAAYWKDWDKLTAERDALAAAVADAEVLLAGRGLTDRATPEEKAALERFRNRGKAPTP